MFVWNEEKYPFSIMDADTMDKFNEEFTKMWNSMVVYEEENAKDGMLYGDGIKEECKIIDRFFDEIFGARTAQKMFGAAYDLADRTSAVKKLYGLAQRQTAEHKKRVEKIAKMAAGDDKK